MASLGTGRLCIASVLFMIQLSCTATAELEHEEPEVEPSSLVKHRTSTHDGAGMQYNFVEQAKEQSRESAAPGIEIATAETSSLLKDLLEAMGQSKRRTPGLPQVRTDAPLSEVLQKMRGTLFQMGERPRAVDGDAAEMHQASASNDYIDHLSVKGLDILEEELVAKVRSSSSYHLSAHHF